MKTVMSRPLVLASLLAVQISTVAAAGSVSQVPLFLTSTVQPNIMLLIDNSGSMSNIVPEAPYDATATYACPAGSLRLATANQIDIRIDGNGIPFFNDGANDIEWVNDMALSTGKTGTAGVMLGCFDPAANYTARLYATDGAAPDGYLPAEYSGHYLNWYFGSDENGANYGATGMSPDWGSGTIRMKPGTFRRMDIAQTAASALVDSLDNTNIGVAAYDGDAGADIKIAVADADSAAAKTALTAAINALSPTGSTPLAEALHEIGRYFVGTSGANQAGHQASQSCSVNGQYEGDLVLHPGTAQAITLDDDTLFDREPGSYESPICHFCQKNFAILLTDGRPQSDQDISATSLLRDYDGDCPGCTDDKKAGRTYESAGSDYLDDVALALFDIDLRPDIDDLAGNEVKNNLTTYTIGFADDQVINDPLMQDTADNGGGEFLTARDTSALTQALMDAVNDIKAKTASASAVTSSSTRLSTSTLIFQARFNSADWSGQLSAMPILSSGAVGSVVWDAANNIPAHDSRQVYAWDPAAGGGISFETGNRSLINAVVVSAGAASLTDEQIDYLRGDDTNEAPATMALRARTAPAGKSPLGDIINSDPLFVAKPNFGYSRLNGTAGTKYKTFRSSTSYKNRPDMVYVGGNDGMLHAFSSSYDATATPPAATGTELFSFIPNAVFAKLGSLTAPGYSHQYLVDGSPVHGDAYLDLDGNGTNESWRSVLVGTTGAGGSGVFALDVTTPSSFGASNVLWDLDKANSNFADLGYTLGQATVARMPDDNFYAVFGNGYDSVAGKAVLYLVRLDDPAQFKKLELEVSSAVNGLSSPLVVDSDDNRIAEAIYAGDLQGNLWKVSLGVDGSGYLTLDSAFKQGDGITPAPLFVALDKNASGTRQPITAPIEVGEHQDGGAMVYFGTGKYYETGDDDTTAAQTQTFYAIRDHAGATVSRTDLVAQTIDTEDTTTFSDFNVRLTSDNAVDYASKKGWYMDLKLAAAAASVGERVVDAPLLRGDQVLFTTLIPSNISCSLGGSGWLVKLKALSGRRVVDQPFDLNRDGVFDDDDGVGAAGAKVAVSGLQFKNAGMISSPVVLSGASKNKFIVSDSGEGGGGGGGGVDVDEKKSTETGRQSWQQLQ